MSYAKQSPAHDTPHRRMYVFTTVALAAFLLGIVAVGFACHGFLKQPGEIIETEVAVPVQAAANPIVDEANAAAEQEYRTACRASAAADREYRAACQASAAALTEYEKAQKKFLDFLGTHFGELTTEIPAAKSLSDSIVKRESDIKEAVRAREEAKTKAAAAKAAAKAEAAKPKIAVVPAPPKKNLVANPQWTELRTQLETLQRQRRTLLEKLTTSHPAVVAVDLDIADVEHKLQTVPAKVSADGEPGPEIPAETIVEAPPVAAKQEELPSEEPKEIALAPLPASDLTAWAGRWRTDDATFHQLADQLKAAQDKYHQAEQQENSARIRQAQAAAVAIPPVKPSAPASVTATLIVPKHYVPANPQQTILWCGVAALLIGLAVARSARISEPVFRAAAAVRQALELPILGLLYRQSSQSPRERPNPEPRWVRGTLLAGELWLAAIVILLAVMALSDQQFWRALIADPLAACSKKFFC